MKKGMRILMKYGMKELVPTLLDEKVQRNIGVGYLKLIWEHLQIKVKIEKSENSNTSYR